MFKMLISSLVLVMLAGCVSPYRSMPASEYGSYEAAPQAPSREAYYDDAYADYPAYGQSSAYSGTAYYPWWSMDYFYLGGPYYHPSYGTSFSFSLSSGYPYYGPNYYPGYYSAWYGPYYYGPWFGTYYGWFGGYGRYDPYRRRGYAGHDYRSPRHGDFRGRDRGHGESRAYDRSYGDSRGRDRGRGSYRGGERVGRNVGQQPPRVYRRVGENDFRGRDSQAGRRTDQRRAGPTGTNRYITIAPSRDGGDRGMVVINRGDGKFRRNRPGPPNRPRAVLPAVQKNPGSAGYQTRSAVPPAVPSRQSNPGPVQRPAPRYSVPYRPVAPDSGNNSSSPKPDSKGRSDNRRRRNRS